MVCGGPGLGSTVVLDFADAFAFSAHHWRAASRPSSRTACGGFEKLQESLLGSFRKAALLGGLKSAQQASAKLQFAKIFENNNDESERRNQVDALAQKSSIYRAVT